MTGGWRYEDPCARCEHIDRLIRLDRCPGCGSRDRRSLVPARFRDKGPFCDHEWHRAIRSERDSDPPRNLGRESADMPHFGSGGLRGEQS